MARFGGFDAIGSYAGTGASASPGGSVGSGASSGAQRGLMAEINMTPLVDVMLVLLVLFIVTVPLLPQALKLSLPRVSAPANTVPVPTRVVTLAIDAKGDFYWNDQPLPHAELVARMHTESRTPQPPEIHLRADQATRYQEIAEVIAAAQQAGIARLAFETEPPSAAAASSAAAAAAVITATPPGH